MHEHSNDKRRGRRRHRSKRPDSYRSDKPQPTKNPILAFFSRIFGGGKSAPAKSEEGRSFDRGPRPERRGRPDRPEGERPRREPPAPIEITTPRLYVGNLSYDVGDSDLFDLFAQAGSVRNVEIARDRDGQRSKGFGFVEMDNLEEAKAAQEKFTGYELMGRKLIISGAKSTAPRPA